MLRVFFCLKMEKNNKDRDVSSAHRDKKKKKRTKKRVDSAVQFREAKSQIAELQAENKKIVVRF